MGMTTLYQIGIVPAVLIALGGLLMLRSAEDERAQRRLTLYLLVVAVLLLLALLTASLMTQRGNRPLWQTSSLLMSSVTGVLALLVLRVRRLAAMGRGVKMAALLLLLGVVGMVIAGLSGRFGLVFYAFPGVLALVVGWVLGRRFRVAAVLFAVLLLLALFGLNSFGDMTLAERTPFYNALGMLLSLSIFILPGLAVVGGAVLLANALRAPDGGPSTGRRGLSLLLALALLGYLATSIFWASVWDQTSDGLGGIFFLMSSAPVAVGAGMVMTVTLDGRRRVVGLLFTVLVPLLLYQALERGWDVSYHAITEARAERIAQALEAYEQREGVYPETLDALTPRHLLRVPRPVELRGESWCYQGGDDFYRLGAFYREYYWTSVELRVYQSAGEPDSDWECEERIAEMKERYDWSMGDEVVVQSPSATPLPPSEAAGEAETLAPLSAGGETVWGSWSPDGAYFLLGERDEEGRTTLAFLDGQSGERCPAPGDYAFPPMTVNLREHHAWLPGGQLLLVDDSGPVVLLAPCSPDREDVTPEGAAKLETIMAHNVEGGRALFKGEGEYWIFDGRTLSWQLLPDVIPNPYDAHWDNAAWQPDGERLALSRLNGRDASEGSTLYLIDGASGDVLREIPLSVASEQSAAHVDWLTPDEVLLMGPDTLRVLDLSADPAQTRDVVRDLFELDLDLYGELFGHSWWVDWGRGAYILNIQANHPRNKAHYIYRSETGNVEMIDEDAHLLLRFPDGQMQQWPRPEAEPAEEETFVMVDVATGERAPALTITGHTPRDYPRLSMGYLQEEGQLAVASSQGLSLHSLPGGERVDFWTLAEEGFSPFLRLAPDGSALVIVRDRGGVYWLPLH